MQIVCKCSHLTNFAVLVDVHGTAGSSLSSANQLALELITYIGLGVSVAGMVVTLFTYLVFSV
jgi:hypothetical protein